VLCPICQSVTGSSDAVSTVDRLSVSDGSVKVVYHGSAQTLCLGKGHAPTAAAANDLSFEVQISVTNDSDCPCHNGVAVALEL